MNEIIEAYINFLLQFKEYVRPSMPKFDERAYTESEYLKVIQYIEEDYKYVNDLDSTIKFLKGD